MQAVNNVFRWSLYAGVVAGFAALGVVFAFWASIEVLSFLMGFSA